MAKFKDPARDYRTGQPINQPPDIAKAVVALAADERNYGALVLCFKLTDS